MYKYIFLSFFVFIILLFNIKYAYSSVFVYSTADIGKKTKTSCAIEKNYYSRALCFISNAKSTKDKDFLKMSGIRRCADIYAIINETAVKNNLPISKLLAMTNDAKTKCQYANERNMDNVSKSLQKHVGLLFVNGDDDDVSKYDVVYELSKAEAMIVNSLNVNRKAKPLRVLPDNIKFDCVQSGGSGIITGLKICPRIKLKYYDRDNKKEKENSILGHIVYIRKAIGEIVKYSLMVKIVPGFPFIPTIAKKNNTVFGLSLQFDFVPVPLPSDYKKERELKGPLDLGNLISPASAINEGSDSDKGPKNTGEKTAEEICRIKQCIEVSAEYITSGLPALLCFNQGCTLNNEDERKKYKFAVDNAMINGRNVLPQPPENTAALLNLRELHKQVQDAIIDVRNKSAKTTDMFNALDTYSDQLKDQMVKINSLVKEISEQFKGIESAFRSWCNKNENICN